MGSVERLLELIDAEILYNRDNAVGGRWSSELHEARKIAAALREQPEARGVVVDAMVEQAARAICIAHGWNPDEPVKYAGTNRIARERDGSPAPQWTLHVTDAMAALTAAQQPAQAAPGDGFPIVTEAMARRLDDYLGGEFDIRIGKQAAHAALFNALSLAAQGGEWKLVPVEPTRRMIEAGIMFGNSPNKVAIIYQSMIHAATTPGDDAAGGG